jgi:ATP-dependent protease ClpP protease subunit
MILDDCLFVLCFVFVVTWLLLLVQKHTVAVGAAGAAGGQACLLLAAGTKGKRHMMPHAKGMME